MFIQRIIIKNYKVIEFCDITLENGFKYLIEGENQDGAHAADSNGSGKTTLSDAPYWCITGESLENCKANDVIGGSAKETEVIVIFNKNGRLAKLERKRSHAIHEVSFTEYDENNVGNKLTDTPTKMKSVIFNYLFSDRTMSNNQDMTGVLKRIIFLSGNRLDAFASEEYSPAERMKIISELLDNTATQDTKEMDKTLKERYKDIRSKLDIINQNILRSDADKVIANSIILETNSIKLLETEIENIKKEIGAILNNKKLVEEKLVKERENNKLKLSKTPELQSQISSLQTILSNHNNELNKLNRFNENLSKDKDIYLEKIDNLTNKYTATENILEKEKSKSSDYNKQYLEDLNKKLYDINTSLKNLNTVEGKGVQCPNCSQSLIIANNNLYDKNDVEKQKELITKLELEKSVTTKELNRYKDIETHYNNYKSFETKLYEIKSEIIINKEKYDELNTTSYKDDSEIINNIELTNKKIVELNKEITEITSSISYDLTNELDSKRKDYEKQYNDKQKEISDKKEQQAKLEISKAKNQVQLDNHYKFKKQYDEGYKFLIICEELSQALKKYSQDRLYEILTTFEFEADRLFNELSNGGNLKFEFENVGESGAKFTVNAKLSENNEFRPLNTFSSGEARRVGLAIALAAKDVILGNNNINFLVLDEALDKLDISGRNQISDYFLKSNNQLFITSHVSDISALFGHKILVTKSNGKSRVELR